MGATRRKWLLGTGAAIAVPLVMPLQTWAQAAKAPAAARRLVLGQSVPLTGNASEIGLAFAAGAKLYIDAWNAKPTNAALRIELRQMDDGYDPAMAAANAQKLLAEGADLLFGFVGTASADAAAAVAQKQDVPFFAPFAASDALRDTAHANVFHVRPSMADEAFKMIRHCNTLGQTRIAVVADDDAMGRGGLAAVNQAIAELKLPPLVGSAFVPPGSDKVDAAVAALMKTQPQAIIQASLFNTTAAFIRKTRKAGYGGAFLNFSVVGIDPLFTALGKEINGVVVSQVVPSPRRTAIPIVKEYLAAVDESDQVPSYESLEGFIAAKALAESARRAGRGADRAALARAMGTVTDYDVGGFRLNLRAGVRDVSRPIDLVTITADGRVIR